MEKDPDARVRGAIDLILRKFAELRSARQVYFWLNQQQIPLPSARGPEDAQEIIWQPARYHAVHSVLKNPIYAGAYAYGRSHTVRRLEEGQKRVVRQLRRRRERWTERWHIRERFPQPDWSIVDLWLARKLLAMHVSTTQVEAILRLGSPHFPLWLVKTSRTVKSTSPPGVSAY